ncbi:MAG: DUF2806 domain-containing protein, partial [Bacteroidetes bacterium]|nr:DUF2806 domain-containing protein [Bacteroidota bacterium]
MANLINIESKFFEKLIEVVSNGIGTIYRPRSTRKMAYAEADKIKIIAKAKAEALCEGKMIEAEGLERLNDRIIAKELKRQKNIDDVVEIATLQFKTDEPISEEPVNEDWTTRFFNIVEDISDNEMKNLWGRILAGEVKQPKSYSLRTLELLRNLSKEEANLFVKIAPFVLKSTGDYYIYNNQKTDNLLKYGISYTNIAKLIEIGLIQPEFSIKMNFKSYEKSEKEIDIIYNNIIIKICMKANSKIAPIPIIILTNPGAELYNLINKIPNMEYIKDFTNS